MVKHLLLALIAVTQLACSTSETPAPRLIDTDLARKVELSAVPFHPQAKRDDCGPAALAMMLEWSGLATSPTELEPKVYTPSRQGTLQTDIVQATRRAGRLGLEVNTLQDLMSELDAGNPVLVLQNLGLKRWPKWHYAVAMGYDLDNQMLRLHSGKDPRFPLAFSTFLNTWEGSDFWGLTVTRPDHHPKTGTEREILDAANGLEQAGRRDAAALAYGTLLQNQPKNLPALMGWGNSRYAEGDYLAASQAFRQAVTLHPEAAEAWNNLAYSLVEQSRLDEALSAAKEAVKRGGPHRAAARATLAEIEAKRG